MSISIAPVPPEPDSGNWPSLTSTRVWFSSNQPSVIADFLLMEKNENLYRPDLKDPKQIAERVNEFAKSYLQGEEYMQ